MKLLIFAGTSEGRKLVENLKESSDFKITVCVATEYGKEVLEKEKLSGKNCEIKSGRLDEHEMLEMMATGFDYVIDATHPYAKLVSENIKAAAEKREIEYIRLLRDKTSFDGDDYVLFQNTDAVVEYLSKIEENVLLAVGSKELASYAYLQKKKGNLYARVLPLSNVIEECNQNGFSGKNLICMQGPFSAELNIAMLRQYNCKYLVTKDTGKVGGADEKYLAAKKAGATLLVVGRDEETGFTFNEILEKFGITPKDEEVALNVEKVERDVEGTDSKCTHFPMFVNIAGKRICVLGAGKIAKRRIETLLKFDCELNIVAKSISDEVRGMIESGETSNQVRLNERELQEDDIEAADIFILATNNKELNAKIAQKVKEKGKIVNVADDMSLCDFYFPGIAIYKELVCGITAQGRNHKLSRRAAVEIRKLLMEADKWEEK